MAPLSRVPAEEEAGEEVGEAEEKERILDGFSL
jgi:hypothetical protein